MKKKHSLAGRKLSEEHKRKISQAHKGKKYSAERCKQISEYTKIAMNRPEVKKKLSEASKGRKLTEEHKRKIGLKSKGRKHSEETRKKLSEIFMGHPVSKETREKLSKKNKGHIPWNKGMKRPEISGKNNPFYGKKHTDETKKKLSEYSKNRSWGSHSEESKAKLRKAHLGRKHALGYKQTPETIRNMRLAWVKRMEERKGQVCPNYNLPSQDYFRDFDKRNNTKGQYAENGGEHYIKKLGYWVDYFNSKLKLIMEWDEKEHYNYDGSLKERDIKRQQEIQEHYPDYLFIRIKEEDYNQSMQEVNYA